MSSAQSSSNSAPSPATSPLSSGIVRSVLSGDTVILRPKGVATPGSEVTVHVAGISAPRLGSRDREDEPQAFPSREFLRTMLVGREVRYRTEYTIPAAAGNGQPRHFSHVYLPPKAPGQPDTNVAHEILAAGWAKVHDSGSKRGNAGAQQPEEEEEGGWKQKLRALQDEAQTNLKGLWGPDDLLKVEYTMPDDTTAFLAEWKGKAVDSIVEQVRDGSMLRVRMLLAPKHHQFINLSLAGIKSPRAGGPSANDSAEPFGEEAKFFVESRLLQRNVRVTLLSVPQPVAAPISFASASSTTTPPPPPPSATVFIGTALHTVGDIAQFLLAAGLARCVDWHAGMLAAHGGMEKYRVAEKSAKDKRLNLWKSYTAPASSSTAIASQPVASRIFEAAVTRIVSGDTINVRKVEGPNGKLGPERRIQLSSIRQPQIKDPQQAGYAAEAREFLRKKLIGKTVNVQLDYIKPKEGDFDEREFATVKVGGKEADVGELLIQKGLATVQRHKRDDEDRSTGYDSLMAAEAQAISEAKGIHSGKESPLPKISDASESAGKANAYLPSLKRAGRVPAVVDFVASASRFKVIVPRENVRLTFVLAGIRAPKTARNPSEKDEPFGREGLEFSTRKALQRDVEIDILSIDKVGGFIGAMYLNKSENLAVSLVEQGFANVHSYSADSTPFSSQLNAAEERAKAAKAGVWHDYDGAKEAAEAAAAAAYSSYSNGLKNGTEVAPARSEYVDCVVSDVRGNGHDEPFGFSVQILDDKIQELERLMQDFAIYHKTSPPAGPGFVPRSGDLVSAKFSQDGSWYRAQIKRAHPVQKQATVVFIDYGNVETVSYKDLKPLDQARFGKTKLQPQAMESRLSFVELFKGKETDYVLDAQDRFRSLAEGRKLIANIDLREPSPNGTLLHLTLYDPSNPDIGANPENCLNVDLVKEGHATLDRKVAYWKSYPSMARALEDAEKEAKRGHRGCYEYGDPTDD
ncbi:hypothetical protein IE53DRAFT_288596 [Violaceomyces palustris]|uniref:Uncharacterized protein n=1 Tax=Violaceomyces palustris TaxID=1673888 RepID=A0ACD0NM15_9BASI|nr:hypothetical protein IE53DRAFT_288596 [Violaceomyces palustris]